MLQIFLDALLRMKTHGVQRAVLFHRERVHGILEIVIGLLDPLANDLNLLRPRAHRALSLLEQRL